MCKNKLCGDPRIGCAGGETERETYDSDVATNVNYGVASSSRQFNSTCNSEAHILKIRGTFEEHCLLSKVTTLNGNRRRQASPHLISPHSKLLWVVQISGSRRYPTMIWWTIVGQKGAPEIKC